MSTTVKTGYRYGQLLKSIHLQHNCDVLDEFHSLLHSVCAQTEQSLAARYKGISPEDFEHEDDLEAYSSYLEDDFYQLEEAKKLGHALAIMGLYKQVETHINRVLRATFPDIGKGKRKSILIGDPQTEINGSKLAGHAALNELRLLNNLIKHNDSIANSELVSANPMWVAGTELQGLDVAYERLKPLVSQYMTAFVTEAYANTKEFGSPPTASV